MNVLLIQFKSLLFISLFILICISCSPVSVNSTVETEETNIQPTVDIIELEEEIEEQVDETETDSAEESVETQDEDFLMEYGNKLGPTLKFQILDNALDSTEPLNLLVQISDKPTDAIRQEFLELNAEIRTEAGDVLTVSLPNDQLMNLAALDTVVYIELSQTLSTEDDS